VAQLNQPEVENFDRVTATSIRLEPDIVGLQISVNDAGAMRFFDRRANLFEDVNHPRDRQRPLFRNDFSQRAAIEILPHEGSDWTILRLRNAEVSDVNDVWVSQPACRFRFTSKPRDKLIVSGELRMDDFNRDGPFRAEMRRTIDLAHSSFSEELFDLI